VTITSASKAYSLLSLMQAVDKAAPPRCCKLNIQLDTGAAGANLYVGNEDVSATNFGAHLNAGQVFVIENGETDRIVLSQLYLFADTESLQVNVAALVY
jgi:hypothetical protein